MYIDKSKYIELLKANRKLDALEAGGVDSWEWYEDALEEYGDEDHIVQEIENLEKQQLKDNVLNILYVHGTDYSALHWTELSYELKEETIQKLKDGEPYVVLEVDDNYMEIELWKFKEVDSNFIEFIANNIQDEDMMNDYDFFILED